MTEIKLNAQQEELCSTSRWDFSDLKAVFINCTLKKSPEMSHTEGLIRVSQAIMEKNKVSVKVIRAVDYEIAYGVYADMTEHGWEKDGQYAYYGRVGGCLITGNEDGVKHSCILH